MTHEQFEVLSNQAVAACAVVYFLALLAHLAEWAAGRNVPAEQAAPVAVGAGGCSIAVAGVDDGTAEAVGIGACEPVGTVEIVSPSGARPPQAAAATRRRRVKSHITFGRPVAWVTEIPGRKAVVPWPADARSARSPSRANWSPSRRRHSENARVRRKIQ